MYLLITVLLILAVAHLTYESIVLPTIRLANRYKLFALRDRLRYLTHQHNNKISDQVFEIVDSSINNTLTLLPHFTVSVYLASFKKFSEKSDLTKKSEARMNTVNNCEIEEVRQIANKASSYLFQTLIYNSLALLILSAPIVIIIEIIRSLFREIKKTTTNIVFTKGSIDLGIDYSSSELVSS